MILSSAALSSKTHSVDHKFIPRDEYVSNGDTQEVRSQVVEGRKVKVDKISVESPDRHSTKHHRLRIRVVTGDVRQILD